MSSDRACRSGTSVRTGRIDWCKAAIRSGLVSHSMDKRPFGRDALERFREGNISILAESSSKAQDSHPHRTSATSCEQDVARTDRPNGEFGVAPIGKSTQAGFRTTWER